MPKVKKSQETKAPERVEDTAPATEATEAPKPEPKPEPKKVNKDDVLEKLLVLNRRLVAVKDDQIKRMGVIVDIERILVVNDLLVAKE